MAKACLLPVLLMAALAATVESLSTLNPGCQSSCGGVDVPYPFGIGTDRGGAECFRPGFRIDCVNNTPFLTGTTQVIPVLQLSVMPRPEARVMLPVAWICYNTSTWSEVTGEYHGVVDFNSAGVYRISNSSNELFVLGCNTIIFINSGRPSRGYDHSYHAGCINYCKDLQSVQDGACSGIGCCHVDIPPGLTDNWMRFYSFSHQGMEFSPCEYAFIVEKGNYSFLAADLHMDAKQRKMPLRLDWAIRDGNINSTDSLTCSQAANRQEYTCVSKNSECVDATNGPGYFCTCKKGYEGNPYLRDGCINIIECDRLAEFPCNGKCEDTEGSYICTCHPGHTSNGDPKIDPCHPTFTLAAKLALGITLGVSFLIVFLLLAFIMIQKRKLDELFEKNGGKILQNVKGLTIFTKDGLKKITKDNSDFLGNGSFGKVYKGTLSDNTLVAVKASIKVDEATKAEFTEEVEIQTYMIHKNILKLIGCCLEVDVPVLVYEFAANGSLQDTLHGNRTQKITLDSRLDIAIGSAEGLRYMHSYTTQTIRHGDVKPDNILLDDKLTPKISDFGLSKLLKGEYFAKTVVGCMGYIDPVFMKTGLLTQKSDVYSFGAVLLELITRKKNVYDENCSLIMEYQKVYEKERSGRSMFDKDIANEEDMVILEEIGKLALDCLKENIEDRPDMTEVAERLVMIRRDKKFGKKNNRKAHHIGNITMDDSPSSTEVRAIFSVASMANHNFSGNY